MAIELTPETAALVDLWREGTGLGRSAAVEVLIGCALTQGLVYPGQPGAPSVPDPSSPSLGELAVGNPVVPVTTPLAGNDASVETVTAPDAAPHDDPELEFEDEE